MNLGTRVSERTAFRHFCVSGGMPNVRRVYYKTRAVLFFSGPVSIIISMWQDETTNWKQRHMSRNEKMSMNRSLLRPPTMNVSDASCDCLQS